MAKLQLLAVKDRQLNAFMRPFAAQTIGQAIRSFRDETNNAQSEINKHPEDYELYHLGEFEEENGVIIGITPKQVALATNLIERKNT